MRTFNKLNLTIILSGLFLCGSTLAARADDKAGSAPSTIRTPLADLNQKKGPLSVNDILQNVQEAQDSVQDMQMRIETHMKDTLSGQEKHFHGMVKIKSDKVFVHYEKPDEQLLYIAGDKMRMYVPDQNTVYDQDTGKGHTPFYLGVGRALKKYVKVSRVSITKDNGDEVVLLFIPYDDKQGFDRMKVAIHKKDWWPYQMEMDTPSVTAKAEFKDLKFNQDLPDSLFKFTPPKDVQVVEGSAF